MGIINNFKDKAEKQAKKQAKKMAKKAAMKAGMHIMAVVAPYLVPALLIIFGIIFVIGIIDLGVELFTGENNPQLIYDTLEIEDVSELIAIEGDETNGYYLDFIDEIDEKLEEIIEKYNKNPEYHNLPDDIDFLKNMLKAEVYTQFPDLGGNIPNDSEDGFQGAITIRRVTPNKSPR